MCFFDKFYAKLFSEIKECDFSVVIFAGMEYDIT